MSIFDEINTTNGNFDHLTLGEVVDTNDPQQMGRIRVACPRFGDLNNTVVEDIPWATPISPLAGINESASRGRGDDRTFGPVAYGMFNVPKVGATVLVGCIDADPRFRIYLGAMHDQFLPHTMPHGRYTYNKTAASNEEPTGPLSSTDDPIQPLYSSQTNAFTKYESVTGQAIPTPRKNFEYRTRGADVGVAGLSAVYIANNDVIYTSVADDQEVDFTEEDGNILNNTQGYNRSRVQEGLASSATEFVYDPQVYSWTTPGFHSYSMSDNADNCRIRVRSTHGHQIIMDDTNERIYISTAGGNTWIEMDENGNIDMYGAGNISMHAEKDINFTAGSAFRVTAKEGIHLATEGEMRIHSSGNLNIRSNGSTNIDSIGDMGISMPNLFLTATADIHLTASGGMLNLQSGATTNILAAADVIVTGTSIHLNGPPATPATASMSASETLEAWLTSRVPEHEPWARTMTLASATDLDSGNSHMGSSEHNYNDANVGRVERGVPIARNPRWHR